MGRTDDIINVAGHRLSTGAMEEVLASHPDVAECAVIGIADPLKGQAPLGLVVLNPAAARDADRAGARTGGADARADRPRRRLPRGARGARLPKTRSGKILARHPSQAG
jgi:propionyl-CoA synthetase